MITANTEANGLVNTLTIKDYKWSVGMKTEEFMLLNGMTSYKGAKSALKECREEYARKVANELLIDASIKSAKYEARLTKDGLVCEQTVKKVGALDQSNILHKEAFQRLVLKQKERSDKAEAQMSLFRAQIKARHEADKIRQEQALEEAKRKAAEEAEAERLVTELESETELQSETVPA